MLFRWTTLNAPARSFRSMFRNPWIWGVLLSFMGFSSRTCVAQGQDTPVELASSLPGPFASVCSANGASYEAYAKEIGGLIQRVDDRLQALIALQQKAQSTFKINPNANTSAMETQMRNAIGGISRKAFSPLIQKAMDMDGLEKRLQASPGNMRAIKREHCQTANRPSIDLLNEERAMLGRNVPLLVQAADLRQQIASKKMGLTYVKELSYQEAYGSILDHLRHLQLLLSLFPGE